MTTTLNIADALPVTTLQEARARVFDLVGHAIRRQLWRMRLSGLFVAHYDGVAVLRAGRRRPCTEAPRPRLSG